MGRGQRGLPQRVGPEQGTIPCFERCDPLINCRMHDDNRGKVEHSLEHDHAPLKSIFGWAFQSMLPEKLPIAGLQGRDSLVMGKLFSAFTHAIKRALAHAIEHAVLYFLGIQFSAVERSLPEQFAIAQTGGYSGIANALI